MKPHVQAWIKIPYNIDQVKTANELIRRVVKRSNWKEFDDINEEEFESITKDLHGEFIVEIMKRSELINDKDVNNRYMRVKNNLDISNQVKYWIENRRTFDKEQIRLNQTEVLVEVKAECCNGCSHGNNCDCPTHIDL